MGKITAFLNSKRLGPVREHSLEKGDNPKSRDWMLTDGSQSRLKIPISGFAFTVLVSVLSSYVTVIYCYNCSNIVAAKTMLMNNDPVPEAA